MKKVSALIMGLVFPVLYMLIQYAVSGAGYWGVYLFKKASDPGAAPEMLQNRATIFLAEFTAWRVVLSAVMFLFVSFLIFRSQKTTLRKAARIAPLNMKTAAPYLFSAGLGMNAALGGLLKWLPIPSEWMAENAQAADSLSSGGLLAQILCVVVMAPLVEEVIYRGLSLAYLSRGFSLPIAVVWQALLFGAFHGTKLQLIYAFLAGLVLGAMSLLCGSIWGSILVHMAFNGASILFKLLPLPGHLSFWAVMGASGFLLLFSSFIGLQFKLKKPDWAIDT